VAEDRLGQPDSKTLDAKAEDPMIVKAMALVCTVFVSGDSKCVTEFYPKTFETMQECNVQLFQWRMYELPRNKKIVLDDCIITSYKHEERK
tara:strand:+ start:4052 stop:4324 length:273 start_codon:yes stop_codon:yes gene_type:complete